MMGGYLVVIELESEDKWIYERMNFYMNIMGKYLFLNIYLMI